MKYFRVVSLLEGFSYLAILSVSAGLISRDYVSILGSIHGALFIVYLLLSMQVSHKQGWSIMVWLLVAFASIVPLAFIAVEVFLRKEIKNNDADLST